jgi:hypothetical protein
VIATIATVRVAGLVCQCSVTRAGARVKLRRVLRDGRA